MDATTNHRGWAERSGEYSPTYYAHLGPNKVSRSLVTVLDSFHDGEELSILEIGCSSGRHLAHLLEHGYEHLHGIDINDTSFSVMAEYFPELAESGTFHTGAIEEVVPAFPDDAFDVVYSVETLQHVHEDNVWVFDELARITGHLLVTVENEGNGDDHDREDDDVRLVNDEFPIYFRDWERIFTNAGLVSKLEETGTLDTIRVFQKPPGE